MQTSNKKGKSSSSGWQQLTQSSFPTGLLIDSSATTINSVYRGTSSAPESKFAFGFTARGNNLNLGNHIYNWPSNSAYVSTSLSKEFAASYAVDKTNTGYVYEINPPSNGVNVENHLYNDFLEGKLKKSHFHQFLVDQEISIPNRVLPEDIKGAWKVEASPHPSGVRTFDIRNEFIPNVEYRPSPVVRFSTLGKALGHGLIALGAGLDAHSLLTAGDKQGYPKETSRIIAAWSSAIVMSGPSAKACFAIGGGVAGPIGALIGGVSCSAVSSVIGYHGASQMVTKGFQKSADKKQDPIEKQAMDRDFLMPEKPCTTSMRYRKKY